MKIYFQDVDEDLMCQICLQPFVAPTDTPCSHTFCQVASSSQFSPHLMSQSSCSLDIPGGPHGPSELSSSRTTLTISPFCKQAYLVASHPLLGPLPSRRQVPSSYPPAPSTLLGTLSILAPANQKIYIQGVYFSLVVPP